MENVSADGVVADSPASNGAGGEPPEIETPERAVIRLDRRMLLLVLLPALFSLLGLIAIILWEMGHPPEWRRALDDYLSRQQAATEMSVARVLTARWPENFSLDQPFVPAEEGVYYRFDSPTAESVGQDARRPVPFPAGEVWCILLDTSASSSDGLAQTELTPRLVVRHADLYNAEWIIYEPLGGAALSSVTDALDDIGCPVDLSQ